MLSFRDVEHRHIVAINSLKQKHIKWGNGLIVVQDKQSGAVLTRLSCHKVLLIIIIGNATITTPLLERCKKYQIPLALTKDNFRMISFIGNELEGNYLLRRKQHQAAPSLSIAQGIIANKIQNQLILLKRIRNKSRGLHEAIAQCEKLLVASKGAESIAHVMGCEGNAAKLFFREYFQDFGWQGRKPRVKCDYLNVILDIGYTFLFHYLEVMLRMWGFDLYVGNLHQLWFQRKSLVCDIVEPFRCIIDHQVRVSLGLRQFCEKDFGFSQGRYFLPWQNNRKYSEVFLHCIQDHKADIYHYVRDYYRYFMGMKSVPEQPVFLFG